MLDTLFEKIEQYDTITLFRHILPDMDAVGSQLGLKYWIQDTYPEKKVYALGEVGAIQKEYEQDFDSIDDETIKQSLAILCDTSTAKRVDDQRYSMADYTIRVDHHVPMESFCDCEYIDEHASATCEMLALAFQEKEIPLSPRAAQMLYTGLVSDNIRFTTSNTNVHSYRAGEYLFSQGVDVIASEELNFGSNYDDYLYETKVRQNSRRYGNALVAIMSKDDYKDISFPRAKEKVYVLAGIRQIKVWALFTEREPGIYNVSLRSKTIDVRPIALDYGGGGHACACGIKNITMPQIREIISRLEQIAK